MLKEFKLDDEGGFIAIITINEIPLEIEILGDTLQDNYVNWSYVQMILDVLRENFKVIDKKSKEFLRLYVDNSGLYSDKDSQLIKGFTLDGISINGPFINYPYVTKHNIQYTLNYYPEADAWVDTYAYFEVYILHRYIEGVRRVQK